MRLLAMFIAAAAGLAQSPVMAAESTNRATDGGWRKIQWNFSGTYSVHATQAWGNLIAAGHPGGAHPFAALNTALVHNGDIANYFSVSE